MEKRKSQFQSSHAVVDLDSIPEHVLKGIGSQILRILKSDESIQRQYEKETGKSYYKEFYHKKGE